MNEVKIKFFDRRMLLILGTQVLVGLLLGVWILLILKNNGPSELSFLRDTGNKLQAAGVLSESANSYEEFFYRNKLESSERANLAYTIGELYEEQGNLERALNWYYRVSLVDSKSRHQTDAANRIVAILEKLNKFTAAKSELAEQTKLSKEQILQGGTVVAEVEGNPIYLHQLNEGMDMIPPEIKKEFEGVEGKKKFLQKMVADRLLLTKAKKLQYDRDPKLTQQIKILEEQFLVQRVMKEEIEKKITIDSKDVKNYYEANKTKYKGDFKKLEPQITNDYKMGKIQALYQQLITDILKTEEVKLYVDRIK